MQFEEVWANTEGVPTPLHELTDQEILAHANQLGSDVENLPRFKFELERRGLYDKRSNQKPK